MLSKVNEIFQGMTFTERGLVAALLAVVIPVLVKTCGTKKSNQPTATGETGTLLDGREHGFCTWDGWGTSVNACIKLPYAEPDHADDQKLPEHGALLEAHPEALALCSSLDDCGCRCKAIPVNYSNPTPAPTAKPGDKGKSPSPHKGGKAKKKPAKDRPETCRGGACQGAVAFYIDCDPLTWVCRAMPTGGA